MNPPKISLPTAALLKHPTRVLEDDSSPPEPGQFQLTEGVGTTLQLIPIQLAPKWPLSPWGLDGGQPSPLPAVP